MKLLIAVVLALLATAAFSEAVQGQCDLSCAETDFVDHAVDPPVCKAHSKTNCISANDMAAKGVAVCDGCKTGYQLHTDDTCVETPTSGGDFKANCATYSYDGTNFTCTSCAATHVLVSNDCAEAKGDWDALSGAETNTDDCVSYASTALASADSSTAVTCLKCKSGMAPNGDGLCVAPGTADANCAMWNWDTNALKCVACNLGWTVKSDGSACVDTSASTANNKVENCAEYDLNANDTDVEATCNICKAGFYNLGATTSCDKTCPAAASSSSSSSSGGGGSSNASVLFFGAVFAVVLALF